MIGISDIDLKRSLEQSKKQRSQETEKQLNTKVVKYLNTLPCCYAEKRPAQQGRAGRVDVTGCIDGRRIELEGKLPGNKPTPIQKQWLRRWAEVGAITGVYRSIADVKRILTQHGAIRIK